MHISELVVRVNGPRAYGLQFGFEGTFRLLSLSERGLDLRKLRTAGLLTVREGLVALLDIPVLACDGLKVDLELVLDLGGGLPSLGQHQAVIGRARFGRSCNLIGFPALAANREEHCSARC